jgi:hypothetical protein
MFPVPEWNARGAPAALACKQRAAADFQQAINNLRRCGGGVGRWL